MVQGHHWTLSFSRWCLQAPPFLAALSQLLLGTCLRLGHDGVGPAAEVTRHISAHGPRPPEPGRMPQRRAALLPSAGAHVDILANDPGVQGVVRKDSLKHLVQLQRRRLLWDVGKGEEPPPGS